MLEYGVLGEGSTLDSASGTQTLIRGWFMVIKASCWMNVSIHSLSIHQLSVLQSLIIIIIIVMRLDAS